MDTPLRFGKYVGLTPRAVLRFDARYLRWVASNLASVQLDHETSSAIQEAARAEDRQSLQRQDGWAWGFGAAVKASAERDRLRRIRVEHEERRKAGQETCPACFPHSWKSCACCQGNGWITTSIPCAPTSPVPAQEASAFHQLADSGAEAAVSTEARK